MNGCEGYSAIAGVYDQFNQELDYEAWADFFERCFTRFLTSAPELVLDLACGTGRMTRVLAKRGYDMIGVDGSASMLSQAYEESNGENILYLCQDMRELELYGTVGAVVCCLDSINYLLKDEDVQKVFSLVHNYLDPDGIFLFDVNTPYKFENVYANNAYILEDEQKDTNGALRSAFCGWQNEYHAQNGICDFYLTLFEENEDGTYCRSEEHQQERCYTKQQITDWLTQCGFELLGIYGGYDASEPTQDCERWYIAARAKKNNTKEEQL